MQLVLALAACAPAQPQPVAGPQKFSMRAAATASPPAKASRPAKKEGRSSLSGRAGKAARKAGAASPARKAQASKTRTAASAASQPDWTALFKAWENGCENSPAFDAFEKRFAFFDRQHGLELGQVDLPEAFKAATGVPTSRYREDYSSYILPLTAGSYYGIAVKAIEFYTGHENGIKGRQLLLDASEKDVKRLLRQQKVVFTKGKAHRAVVSGTATQTAVTCDESD